MSPWECRVVRDYVPQYAAPISVARGAQVVVHHEDIDFPGWWWCTASDGRSGWVPCELLEPPVQAEARARLVDDYSATELAVMEGETVTMLEARRGWLSVRNERGARGWIPASHVTRDARD